jgi:hypothetical protein
MRRLRDGRLRLSIGGFDRRYVRNVEYRAGKKRVGRSTKAPFRVLVRTRARKLQAFVTMIDARRTTLKRTR